MNLISKFFSDADNQLLRALPIEEEVEKIAMGFPSGKSPGGDGVTYDFLKGCWSFVGSYCLKTILAFWDDAKLSQNTINGIVKMTPKKRGAGVVGQLEKSDYVDHDV